jgi:hypothetical protein
LTEAALAPWRLAMQAHAGIGAGAASLTQPINTG